MKIDLDEIYFNYLDFYSDPIDHCLIELITPVTKLHSLCLFLSRVCIWDFMYASLKMNTPFSKLFVNAR